MADAVIPVPERYVRTNAGLTVHRADCRHLNRVKYAHEWKWAEGMTPDEIVARTEPNGLHYHWCSTCLPWAAPSDNDSQETP